MSYPDTQLASQDPTHLIIVCCHAIWLGGPTCGEAEAEWAIEPFQCGESPTFIKHIKAGLRVLSGDAKGMLLFSGSSTKPDRTNLSEAESYLNLARANNYFSLPPSTPILLDTRAVDSYQNLLFPLLTFHQVTHGQPPAQITIVSHAFKRERFLDIHCRALRWPCDRISFVGIDPDIGGTSKDQVKKREAIEKGEEKARRLWKEELYGVGGELGKKRKQRGWKGPEAGLRDWRGEGGECWVRDLVEWSGGDTGAEVYGGWLPWDEGHSHEAK